MGPALTVVIPASGNRGHVHRLFTQDSPTGRLGCLACQAERFPLNTS